MTARTNRFTSFGLAWVLLAVAAAALLSSAPAQAEPVDTTSHRDYQYPEVVQRPTADKPQSKLWYAYGTWWGLLAQKNDGTVHIFRLGSEKHAWRDTGVVVDARVGSTGDALWDGQRLYVASRVNDDAIHVSRFSFDLTDETWSRDGRPDSVGPAGSASATIAKDSRDRLWITYTKAGAVWVAHTTNEDRGWTAPFNPVVPDTTVSSDDISAIVSFDGRIGVMWSDQESDRYRFAVHDDDADDDVWTEEDTGTGFFEVDDHLNVHTVRTPTGTRILAAVKTSLDEVSGVPPSAPQIAVLDRSVDGTWSTVPAGDVADGHTRPILAVDSSNQQVYLIVAAAGIGVYYKRAPLDNLTFPAGRGQPLITSPSATVGDPTATKAPVTADSGLVVLAHASSISRYFHAEFQLPRPEKDDSLPPTKPGAVVGEATTGCQVNLIWSPATDDTELLRYELRRDGEDLASVTATSYTDLGAGCGTVHRYSVRAVDTAGNVSAPTSAPLIRTPAVLDRGRGIWRSGSTAGANRGGNGLTLPLPDTAAGDVLIASVDADGRPDITPPPGWKLVQQDMSNTRFLKNTYVRVATGTQSAVERWTWSGAGATAVGNVLAYRGVSADDPVAGAAGRVNGTSTTVATPRVAVGSEGSAVVGLFGVAGLVSVTPPPAMVGSVSQGNKTGPGKRITGSAAELLNAEVATGALTATTSRRWPSIGQVIVLRPDAAPGE